MTNSKDDLVYNAVDYKDDDDVRDVDIVIIRDYGEKKRTNRGRILKSSANRYFNYFLVYLLIFIQTYLTTN